MSRVLWFVGGFVVTLVVVVAAALLSLRALGVEPGALLAVATPPASAESVDMTTPAPGQPADVVLAWQSEASADGACALLQIDAAHQAHYGPCDQGQRLAALTQAELDALLYDLLRFRAFDYTVLANAGAANEATITLSFAGTGPQPATPEQQAEVAAWGMAVYARLSGTESRDDLVARSRADLAARLGLALEEVRLVAVADVRWPDACLGLRQSGLYCAHVATRGYQVILSAGNVEYEYRADVYGHLRSTEGYQAPYLLAPLSD